MMKFSLWIYCVVAVMGIAGVCSAEPLLIDHGNMDITSLTQAEVDRARSVLHIVYGHTSHGSQLEDGMTSLVGFANNGGRGLSLETNSFAWNNGGSGGALDMHDQGMGGDAGYYPQWVVNTSNYLNNAANSNVNVVIWSWCGQMPGKYSNGTLTNDYLAPMAQLEADYPDVAFVYMTGHADIWDDADQKAACEAIRNWCSVSNRVLYDFSDIEHWDPDGVYYEFVNDSCDLHDGAGGAITGNWATAWQASHVEDVDWYACGSAHSEPLNANQKAYAAWALWCGLAADLDRDGLGDEWEERHGGRHLFAAGTNDFDGDGSTDWEEYILDRSPTNAQPRYAIDDISSSGGAVVEFSSATGRVYALRSRTNLVTGGWLDVTSRPGTGAAMSLTDDSPVENDLNAYRVEVSLPE